jgi:hypothetical protein
MGNGRRQLFGHVKRFMAGLGKDLEDKQVNAIVSRIVMKHLGDYCCLLSVFLFLPGGLLLSWYCMLSVVCLRLSIACCLLFIAYCLLPIVYCLLPIAYCLLSIVYCLLSIVYCLLSIAKGCDSRARAEPAFGALRSRTRTTHWRQPPALRVP